MIGKGLLPKSFFGRALLILVLPTVLIQMVMMYVFFDRHIETVTRYMSKSLAGEAAFLLTQLKQSPNAHHGAIIADFMATTKVDVAVSGADTFRKNGGSRDFPEFQEQLRSLISEPFTVRKSSSGDTIDIRVLLGDQVLVLQTSVKRLESRTTTIFVLWMIGTSAIFLLIAVLFMRNQVRPIRQLAEAAENFGRGVDMPDFRPHGATEIRKAARAFIVMRERLKRQMRTRTDMLSGISHDLRTPLTRMKLELAMLGENDLTKGMHNDVQQMEYMIQEYLDFARGEGREEPVRSDLLELLRDVVADYQRLNAEVKLLADISVEMDLRVTAVRRMLHNIIDNALRYGKYCSVSLVKSVNYCEIYIDDGGPGIPAEKREDVFKPFNRLDPSRNVKTGGVGLGLTIARDIALAHGGNISLEHAPAGGLRVVIRLPI